MELVILDSYAAVSNDLSLDCLSPLCTKMTNYERTPPEETAQRIGNAELVIINKTVLSRDILEQCPNLRYIGIFATGYNNVDIDFCRERGIVVSNAPSYSTNAVAQVVFAYLLHFFSRIAQHDEEVHAGKWENCKDFAFYDPRIRELANKTIGIIGFGSIGRKVAALAQAFDMAVLVYSRTFRPEYEKPGLHFTSLEQLLEKSDVVTLHCPLFPENTGMIGRPELKRMKKTAFLINTARGGLIDEKAAADALNEGQIAGMAADVVSAEPIHPENPLLHAHNCILTPHIAWAAREARERLIDIVRENLQAFLDGHPQNNVANSK